MLSRYRCYEKKKSGIGFWQRELYARHHDVEVNVQENPGIQRDIGDCVIANFPNMERIILNVISLNYSEVGGIAAGYTEEDKPCSKKEGKCRWGAYEEWEWT